MISEAELHFIGDGCATIKEGGRSYVREAGFRVEDEKIAKPFGRPLPPQLADLVDVAMSVYFADRSVRRRPAGAGRYELGWKRRLTLEVPVRCLDRWKRPEVHTALVRSLEFFTEDDWRLVFVRRQREPRTSERQLSLFPADLVTPVRVALFSGGLDSLAGVAADIDDRSAGSLILVAGTTHPRLGATLEVLARKVRDAAARDLRFLAMPLGLRQTKSQYNSNEPSQRTRGFLYGTLGAVAAAMAGGHEVIFYENGIGAINLPYTPAQLGTHSKRSTNPVALAHLGEFLALFLERKITLRLPYLFSTKGEVVAPLMGSVLRPSIATSVTCDRFPLRHKKAPQCGVCTSCLLRRQSLWAAGLGDEDAKTAYFYDVVAGPGELADKRWDPLRDMLGQVDTFRRALATPRPWDALTGEYPMLRQVAWTLDDQSVTAGPEEAERQLMGLFARYCDEWERFPAQPPSWELGEVDHATDWRFRHAC